MMDTNKKQLSNVERGWIFSSQILGANTATQAGCTYVGKVEDAIAQLSSDLTRLKTNGTIPSIGGFAAEYWHADTLNIDAIAAKSMTRAKVLVGDRQTKWSTDIRVTNSAGDTTDYGVKYMKNAVETAKHHSLLDTDTRRPGYEPQFRLSPEDQKDEIIRIANQRAASELRSDVADAYRDTATKTVDRITDDDVSSSPLSKGEDLEIATEIKDGQVNVEKHGVSANSAIKPEYIMKQAVNAGLSAATITMIMQTAPEIFKAVSYLIKTGEIDINQVKRIGVKAVSSGAEGFLRGSIACTLQVMCEKGAFGAALKGIDATMLGTVVALTLETVKNSILVAAGQMTPAKMGTSLIDSVLISSGYIVGAKIGGIIGQVFGFELPVIGYILGSLIGCATAAVYNIGKKHLISFCVDTGFTCFGLVEQDYTLPEEALRDMGVDFTPITRVNVSHTELDRTPFLNKVNQTPIDTIDIKVLRRGIIGVKKIGFIY